MQSYADDVIKHYIYLMLKKLSTNKVMKSFGGGWDKQLC